MTERTVSLAELVDANQIEVGAGRPRSVPQDQDPLPILRVADVLDGKIGSPDFTSSPESGCRDLGPKVSRSGDIVLTVKGTVGRVALMPSEGPRFAYSPQLCYFRPRADGPLAAQYLYYWFKSADFWIQANALKGQTDMADFISLGDILSLKLRLPSRTRQEDVAGVLGVLDEKIAVNERTASVADALIRSLWDSALRGPGARKLPLFDALHVTFGAPFKSSEFNTEGVGRPLLRIRDLKTYEPKVWTTQRHEKETVVAAGETIAGMDAEFRPTFWMGESALLNQRVLHARSRVGGGSPLCREALREPLALVESYKTGTTVAHLNKSDLATLVIEVPAADEISSFEAATARLHERLVATASENRSLAALRDVLLPQLMSGKLRVRDAEKIVEDAV
ncbi:hypothetical protein ACIQJW_32275 [Streptomyces californicus]|uniref:restriction endonuclease subunit S n=1 Tax=Streptomyces californicus TaxID=67351 RepID=UPI003811A769